jgi:pimeloyl-ACP methyl ester carboxylesterase
MGESLSEVIPDAKLAVIPEVGIGVDPAEDPIPSHCPQLHKPDEFNRHLLEFLGSQR